MGGKEVPTQNIWGTVSEISVTVDVCSATVKYYILVRGTSEGDKSQSHISSHFAPIENKYYSEDSFDKTYFFSTKFTNLPGYRTVPYSTLFFVYPVLY